EARLTQHFSPVRILLHVEPTDSHSDRITFAEEV
ncbi:MAG: cation-efflux pump, partial [Microcystis panniformis]